MKNLVFKDYYSLGMSLIYFGLGVYILLTGEFMNFAITSRIGIGVVLVLYGIIRFYSMLKRKRERESEDYDEE